MNKTLQQVRDEYAKEINYSSRDAIPIDDSYNKRIDQIACRYATEYAKESLKLASENARISVNGEEDDSCTFFSECGWYSSSISIITKSILSEDNLPKHI